jgi:hypothetical protein
VQIGMSIMRVRDANRSMVTLSGWVFFSLTILSAVMLPIWGLSGIGYAWLIRHGTGSLVSVSLLRKKAGDKSDKIKCPIAV